MKTLILKHYISFVPFLRLHHCSLNQPNSLVIAFPGFYIHVKDSPFISTSFLYALWLKQTWTIELNTLFSLIFNKTMSTAESVAKQIITTDMTGKAVSRLWWGWGWSFSTGFGSLQYFWCKTSTLSSLLILVMLVFTDMITRLYELSEGLRPLQLTYKLPNIRMGWLTISEQYESNYWIIGHSSEQSPSQVL